MFASSSFGAVGELAATRHGVITRTQAADRNLCRNVIARWIREGHLLEPVSGVLVISGTPDTWMQRLAIATSASGGVGVVACRSAAALHGIDGYEPGPLEVLVPNHRRIALDRLVVRRGALERADVLLVEGLACTGIARTLCDLAVHDTADRARGALEWAWRNGHSLSWIEHTAQRLLDGRSRGGPTRVQEWTAAMRQLGRPTESPLEARLSVVLDGIPGLIRQHEIRRPDGTFVARPDFAIPHLRIAIEAHSRRHHWLPATQEHDAEREAELHAEGWLVRFVTDAQMRKPAQLRHSIDQLIVARTSTPLAG
jgi:very-short-patch-repair endonuclease